MTSPRVSTFLVRAVVEVVERAGVKREPLLEAARLPVARLDDLVAGFELAELDEILARAVELTRDEALGLRLGEQSSEAAFDVVAHLTMHAPTLRDALGLCSQFQGLLMGGSELHVREQGDAATLRCEFPRSTERADRMLAEFAMVGFVRLVRSFAGSDTELRLVSFEHRRPPYADAYRRLFGGAERFSGKATAIEVAREVLDRRQLHHHPELYSLLHAQAEARLERLARGATIVDRVRQHLLTLPPSRLPDMGEVARNLGLSERSLRRKLTDEGAVYKTLREEILETHATRMLGDPRRSIQETAQAMGFSDAAAFQRAFKRWKGVTPGEFKKTKG